MNSLGGEDNNPIPKTANVYEVDKILIYHDDTVKKYVICLIQGDETPKDIFVTDILLCNPMTLQILNEMILSQIERTNNTTH